MIAKQKLMHKIKLMLYGLIGISAILLFTIYVMIPQIEKEQDRNRTKSINETIECIEMYGLQTLMDCRITNKTSHPTFYKIFQDYYKEELKHGTR